MSVDRSPSTSRTVLGGVSRYDVLLAVLPVAFALAATAGVLSSVPLRVSLAAASLFGGVLVADALFVNPPVDR